MDSDSRVMLAVKAGEISKLSIIFERYKGQLYGYFYKNTYKADLSEDLVQNVFVRILKYRDKYNEHGKFKSWIFQIAHHIMIDQFKQTKKEKTFYGISTILTENPTDELIQNEEVKAITKALGKLNKDQREILVLSKYQDLKYKDIADILGISEANVKVRIHRALIDLKKIYYQLTEIEL